MLLNLIHMQLLFIHSKWKDTWRVWNAKYLVNSNIIWAIILLEKHVAPF